MKRMLKTLGAATAIGTFILVVPPAMAAVGQGTDAKAASEQPTHVEHHKQMHGDGQPGMNDHKKGHSMGHMKSGYMGGMMGNGMGNGMGDGMGHMASNAANPCASEKDLSAEDVKNILVGHLAWQGNKRLKVGEVKKKNDDTYIADIVTVDNSLVERLEVDRKTGAMRRTE